MIKPMVARLVRDPFYRKDWIFEIKWDGFRVISEVEGAGKVKLYSRNHNSFNKRFPELVRELAELKQPAVLDGERSSRWMKKGNRVSNG